MIRFKVFYLAVLSHVLLSGCHRSNLPLDKPNIILIYVDDLGYGDVETLNPKSKIPTPNITSLAAEGLSFINAHSPSSVCSPSRYSLLTGKYSWRSKMKKGVKWIWESPLLQQNDYTIAEMLKDQGYATALIGKWHLGWNWPTTNEQPATLQNGGKNVDYGKPITGGPLACGFDCYFGDDTPSFPPHAFIENDRMAVMPTEWHRETLVTHSGEGIFAIQKENLKLILSSGSGGKWTQPTGDLPKKVGDGDNSIWRNVQLYDMETDPFERRNLAEENQEKVVDLMSLLKSYVLNGRSTPENLINPMTQIFGRK